MALSACLAYSNAHAQSAPATADLPPTSSLPALVKLAIQTNPLVKSKFAELQSAEFDVQGAKWQRYPTPFSRGERLEGKNLVVAGLRQPLWTGGRLTADIKAAEANMDVSEWELSFSHHEIALRIASAWLQAVSARGRLQALQASLTELEALQSMMKRRVAIGYSGSVDISLLQARLIQTQNDIDRTQSEITIGLNSITQLTGQTWSVEQLVMPSLDLKSELSDTWVDSAVASHPANRRAMARLELAESQVLRARTDIMPTVSARAEYQSGQYLGSNLEGYRFVVGFEQSFGAGLASSSTVDSSKNLLLAAQEDIEVQRRELLVQIRSDLASLESARKRVLSLQTSTSEMQTVSDSYRRAFDAGRRSWLELLNIVRERTDVAQQLAQAEAEVVFHSYRLQVYQGIFE